LIKGRVLAGGLRTAAEGQPGGPATIIAFVGSTLATRRPDPCSRRRRWVRRGLQQLVGGCQRLGSSVTNTSANGATWPRLAADPP